MVSGLLRFLKSSLSPAYVSQNEISLRQSFKSGGMGHEEVDIWEECVESLFVVVAGRGKGWADH
jgi:hypothetical protein